MSYFVPPEIVATIVQHVLEDDFAPTGDYKAPGENSKPSWTLIEPLTLVTRTFRQVALERWFRTLYIRSATDIECLDEFFPYLKSKWCKRLHCVQLHDDTAIRAWNLAGFKRLTSVRIDWLDLHFTPVVGSSLGATEFKPFVNVECPVKAVEIRGLRYPSPMSLRAFTAPFLHMTTLELECLRIWCGLCHTCSLVRFPDPRPKGFLYEGGLGLPIHYARVLFSLDCLQKVTITLPDIGHGLPSPGLSTNVNNNLWAGECDGCMYLMYDDDAFTKSWLKRKRGITSENVDERGVYVSPPNLKKVEWKFWEFDSSKGYSQEEVSNDDDLGF